jgi:hypothetical protein
VARKRIENRVRFRRSVSESILDRNRRILSFAPGSIFAFVRWTSNDFGTVLSRIDILRAAIPGQSYSTVPWIRPGGESLLRLSGWPKVERVLQLIDAVERSTSILPTRHPTIGTTFTTDCRSTKHREHTPDPVTTPGSIGGGSRHERPVRDNFHDICNGRPPPFDGRRSNAALHMERIK